MSAVKMLRLAAHAAALALAVSSPALSAPVTLDLLLGLETFGRIAIDPTGRTAVFEERRAGGDLPRYDLQAEGAIRYARLYRWEVGSDQAARPLLEMGEDAGYTMGPFSPDGEHLVLYRLDGDQWRLGVINLKTEHVSWTNLSPETGAWGRSVEWLSNRTLTVIAMPGGGLPSRLARTTSAQSRLPAMWAVTAAGGAAYKTAGVEAPGEEETWRELWQVEVESGHARRLSAGPFLDMEASPDGRHLALLLEGDPLPPPEPELATEVRKSRSLRLIEVDTGRMFDPPSATDISTSLLAWSGDSRRLLVQALAPTARLLAVDSTGSVVDVTPSGVTPAAPTDFFGLPTAKAGWLADQPVFVGAKDGGTGWYIATRDGERRLEGVSERARLVAQGQTAALFAEEGQLIRIRSDLTIDKIGPVIAVGRSDGPLGVRNQASPMKASAAFSQDQTGRICRITADVGDPPNCVKGAAGAAISWSRGVSLYKSDEEAGDLIARDERGSRIVHGLNPELINVKLPEPRLVETPAGARGWLFLPMDEASTPPPVVAIPYPGEVNLTAPRSMRLESQSLALQGQLLVAAGYAVLFPDLPATAEPIDGLADRILAVVDAAAADNLVDAQRVGLWGWSFGGWAAVMSAAQSPRFRAVVSLNGAMSHPSAIGEMQAAARAEGQFELSVLSNARWLETGQAAMLTTYWTDPERYRRNSPFEHADRITAPVLLVAGDLDFGLTQSEQMYGALLRLNRPVALTILFGEEHAVESPGNIRVYYRQVLSWFDRHLRQTHSQAGSAIVAPTPP